MTRVPWSPEARWEAVAVWRSACRHGTAPLDSFSWNAFTATPIYFRYAEATQVHGQGLPGGLAEQSPCGHSAWQRHAQGSQGFRELKRRTLGGTESLPVSPEPIGVK